MSQRFINDSSNFENIDLLTLQYPPPPPPSPYEPYTKTSQFTLQKKNKLITFFYNCLCIVIFLGIILIIILLFIH